MRKRLTQHEFDFDKTHSKIERQVDNVFKFTGIMMILAVTTSGLGLLAVLYFLFSAAQWLQANS